MDSKDANKFLNKLKKEVPKIYPSSPEKAMTSTGYMPGIGKRGEYGPLSTTPYSGEATSDLLRHFSELPQSVSENLSESEWVRNQIREKALRDSLMGGTRGDIQESRRFFSEADWPKAVSMIREGMTPAGFQRLVNHESGLLGISGTSSDMRDLLNVEERDTRAAAAVELFCYQAGKWIGAFAAVLGGVDTVVFAGGIGENSPVVRARICANLGFLGIRLGRPANARSAAVISTAAAACTVRVIPTDESRMIALSVARLLRAAPPATKRR
jgi:hypothetical protein